MEGTAAVARRPLDPAGPPTRGTVPPAPASGAATVKTMPVQPVACADTRPVTPMASGGRVVPFGLPSRKVLVGVTVFPVGAPVRPLGRPRPTVVPGLAVVGPGPQDVPPFAVAVVGLVRPAVAVPADTAPPVRRRPGRARQVAAPTPVATGLGEVGPPDTPSRRRGRHLRNCWESQSDGERSRGLPPRKPSGHPQDTKPLCRSGTPVPFILDCIFLFTVYF